MKKIIPALVAIVLIILVAAVCFGTKLLDKYAYSKEYADLDEYFEIDGKEDTVIILQDERLADRALLRDGEYYLTLETVHKYFNTRFYEDQGEGLLLYTTPTEIMTAQIGADVYTVSGGAGDDQEVRTETREYPLSFYEGEVLYLAIDYVKEYTNFSYEAFTGPNRLQIYTQWDDRTVADVTKDTQVRFQGGIKSDILEDVSKGDTLTVLEEMEKWSKVKTEDAIIGYVENKRLTDQRTESQEPVTDYVEPEYTSLTRDHKICLAWHQVMSPAANSTLSSVLEGTAGINVISPTWMSLNGSDGQFDNIGSFEYVEAAHNRGLEVWALVDNLREGVDSYQVLSSTTNRARLIDGLVTSAKGLGIDGINIDFEQLTPETGEHFVQFLRELSIPCRKNGIVLSVDNYVPMGNTDYYNRTEQGIVADYVIIMGYDEHWSGSEEAGSVASIDYVEHGIQKTVEEVPSHKVINGIPLYTRVWKTKGSEVSSDAVGMGSAEAFLSKHGVQAVWDEATCQNYGEFEQDGALYQVWLEDEQSIEVKLNVMRNYDLAGVAAWKLTLEKPSVWNVIDAYVNDD